MPAIGMRVDGDHEAFGRQVGVNRYPVSHTTEDWEVDIMDHGMQSGATSLMIAIPATLDRKRYLLLIETSLNAWMMASNVLAAHCRDEIERPGWVGLNDAARAVLLPRYAESIRRAIPSATQEQAMEAAVMMLDSLGADRP